MTESVNVASIISEKDLLDYVIEYAQAKNWRVAHFRPGMTSRVDKRGRPIWVTPVQADGKGFPDLILIRRDELGGRFIVAELKSENGKVTKAQQEWLGILTYLAGYSSPSARMEVYIWRPSDRDALERVLE